MWDIVGRSILPRSHKWEFLLLYWLVPCGNLSMLCDPVPKNAVIPMLLNRSNNAPKLPNNTTDAPTLMYLKPARPCHYSCCIQNCSVKWPFSKSQSASETEQSTTPLPEWINDQCTEKQSDRNTDGNLNHAITNVEYNGVEICGRCDRDLLVIC